MESIMEVIPAWIMVTIGLVFLGMELMLGSFVIIFFGAAFILVGVSGFFFTWPSGEIQVLTAVVLATILNFSLRKLFMRGMSKEDMPLETMQTGDLGVIVEHAHELRVAYKGTTWAFRKAGAADIKVGDEVVVDSIKNNLATVSKAQDS